MATSDQQNSSYIVGAGLVFLVILLFGVWIVLKAPWLEETGPKDATTPAEKSSETTRRSERTGETSSSGPSDGGDDSSLADERASGETTSSGSAETTSNETGAAEPETEQEKADREDPQADAAGTEAGSDRAKDDEKPGAKADDSASGDGSADGPSTASPKDQKEQEPSDERSSSETAAPNERTDESDSGPPQKDADDSTGSQVAEARRKEKPKEKAKLSPELQSIREEARKLYQKKHFSRAIDRLKTVRKRAPSSMAEELEEILSTWKKQFRQKKKLAEIWFRKARDAQEDRAWKNVLDHTKKALSHLPHSKKYRLLRTKAQRMKRFEGMVKIAGDTYTVGHDSVEGHPERDVDVDAFYVDRHEVTNSEYAAFLTETDHRAPLGWTSRTPPAGKGDHPVTGVSFGDAKAYAEWAGKRLPSEVEWEVAARGAQGRSYPWGDSADGLPANTVGNGEKGTVPVTIMTDGGTPEGLQHMVGNVAEWTTGSVVGEGGTRYRIVKGGSFLYPLEKSRPVNRLLRRPDTRLFGIGFRCVLDAPDEHGSSSSGPEVEKGE